MSTQQSGLVAGNKQNEAGGATGKSRSRFPLSYTFLTTERFAEYTPFFVEEGVSGDRLPLHSNHEVQTYTLKSPVLQNLLKKKDYFVVPMQAILPLNWEKFYTNPNIGEDVPVDSGCGVSGFWSKVRTNFIADWNDLYTLLSNSEAEASNKLDMLFRFFIHYERFYSAGSLLETLGVSGHNFFRCENDEGRFVTFDEIFDVVLGMIEDYLTANESLAISFALGGTTYEISASSVAYSDNSIVSITLREALELMRDDMSFGFADPPSGLSTTLTNIANYLDDLSLALPETDAHLNTARLWAYQLVCAHYYSNDHVDFIYSAELFRQYIQQLVTKKYSASQPNVPVVRVFSVNGYEYIYDSLSAFHTNNVLSYRLFSGDFSGLVRPEDMNEYLAYWTAMLSFKRSLRFMDYFTGSRSLPLAVGDTSVNVNAGKVSVIDLSRSSMMTKFLQAVNRSGRKFGAYMQELFGITPKYDYHNPLYLAHTSDLVGAQETENTGAAQVSNERSIAVTSRLRATSSRYAFEYEPDRDCIVIGISYYDLPRVYSRATERQNFFLDRFDMFNPYMQFIGDQPISEAELGTDTPSVSLPFSYTNRHMEYKQRYNQCAGGFCVPSTGLDHWIFIADELRRKSVHHIGPSFIRSFNSELDKFYQSLTGYSLGTYFHFIVRYDNRQDASRPMAYNPTINV